MPTYDYVCQACGHKLEIFQSMADAPKRKCPKCKKSKLERQIGRGAAVLFKGSGFYQTDYRSNSYTEGAKQDAKKDGGGDAAKPDTSAQKPPAKPAAKDRGSKPKD
jgi:putative FmdB family regulatory protein